MIAVVHPTGNQNVRSVLTALHGRGLLAVYLTTVGHSEHAPLPRWLPPRWHPEWRRRAYALPADLIHGHPARELGRLGAERAGWRFLTRSETGVLGADAIYRHLDCRVARQLDRLALTRFVGAVYGYEYGCHASFRRARQMGLSRFYDLPIVYWQTAARLLEEEAARLPAWKPTLPAGGCQAAKAARRTRELADAEVVFCPSRFVADSVPTWARESKEVVVAPFGSPAAEAGGAPRREERRGRLRVLFAGSMSQRKGLGDLFAAMHRLRGTEIELVVLGAPIAPMAFYRGEYPGFIHEATRPHADVLRLMRTCDVLALPSIAEGRALVMQEAMSQGLPLLITANTGGEDLVEPGRTGFLVPIRSPEALADRLAWFAAHREETRAMGERARAKAATFQWADYGATIAGAIERHVSPARRGDPVALGPELRQTA